MPPPESPLPAGWYLLTVAGSGAVAPAPGVRADSGTRRVLRIVAADGRAALHPLPPPAGDGTRRLVLALQHGSSLTIDGGPVSPDALRPLGRGAAMLRIAAGLGAGLPAALLDAVRAAPRGAGAAASAVVARYRRRIAAAAGWGGSDETGLPLDGTGGRRSLRPVKDLARAGDGTWVAIGDDPGFLLASDGDGPVLAGGWYRFSARIDVRGGQLLAPCLYPDYGDGMSDEQRILLPQPDTDGVVETLVLLKFDVRALRFDPSTRRCTLAIDALSLRRLGRPAAFARMLAGIRDESGRGNARARAEAAADFLKALPRGATAAAGALFERYLRSRRQGAFSYDAWVRLHDTLGVADLAALRAEVSQLPSTPLFSLIVPVYGTPERWLRRCLDSVLAQAWPHWELCIADDASPDPRVGEVLREYMRRDPRVRVAFRERNGHISEASNTALAMARGDFIGLLDHDDELRPHALLEMAKAIQADPALRVLYSDEDKIDAEGRRMQPYFKPDWNPELLLGQNYLCHFSVIETALARDAGAFRTGYEGSQDHDLLLRCVERIDAAQIHHVPKVLYHWRAIAGSTALHREAKDYAADAGARAVADHLQRTGTGARVEALPHGHYRVHWPIPDPAPRVTVIIPTRDRLPLLRTCVDSIRARTDYPDYRILVVDNGSVEPETLAWLDALRTSGDADVMRDDSPFNYARLNNAAVAACDTPLVALLNNDIEVISPGWLRELAGHALRPGVGAVGAMLYYPDDTIQHAGVILGLGGIANHAYIRQPRGYGGHGGRAKVAQALSAVTGACLVVRRDTWLEAGGLDERLQVAFNDIDFCLRLRQRGLRNVWTPFAELYHHESASRGREDSDEKLRRFHGEVALMESRWGTVLFRDPAYNPNLTLDGFDFELAFPPRHARPHRP